MRSRYLLTLSWFIPCFVFGQAGQTKLWGIVKNTSSEIMNYTNIVVMDPRFSNKILASAFTDENGKYQVTFRCDGDSLTLRASRIELNPIIMKIPNRSGEYDIVAEERTTELQEVVVKAKKIYSRSDTIHYNVSSFLSAGDQSIADVLKKMPGITVANNGQISFQGKPIKNFYIEGLNLMKSHYGIATNNIDPHNISGVQILENHQDIKALKGLRSEEQASINIKLKKGIKGVFNLISTLGGGYGDEYLWNNTAIATYFKRNSQLLATYKGNNTGEDLHQELYSFDNDYSRTSNISEISLPPAPGIDRRFYYFNHSHNTTFNNVYRVGKSGELGINVAYLNDRDSRQSHAVTANTLPDGTQNTVDEAMTGMVRTEKAYGDFTYLLNNDRIYLKEQIKFDRTATDVDSRTLATGRDVTQMGRTDIYRLLHRFHLTDRSSKRHGYEIISFVNLEKRPHCLSVSPNLFLESIAGNLLHQTVEHRNFSTENCASLLSACKTGNVTFHPSVFMNFHHNSLTSSLSEWHNDIRLDNLSAGISTETTWHAGAFEASLYLPIGYRYFGLKNKFSDVAMAKHRLRVEPRFGFSVRINSYHSIRIKSALGYSVPSVQNLYAGYILTSYRTLSVYDVTELSEGMNLLNSVSYDFKDILSMSFAGVDLTWNRQKPDMIYGAYHDGIVSRMTGRRTDETSGMFTASLRGSRGFDLYKMKVGLSASYSRFKSPLLVQDTMIRYTGHTTGVVGDFSLSPWEWLSVSYRGSCYRSASRQEGFGRMPWLTTVTNDATLHFDIPDDIGLQISLHHYYNNVNNGDKSFLLFNAEARYSVKRFTFTLTCDNLLNRKRYIYTERSALTEANSIHTIRPRSILLKIRFRIF